VFARLGAIAPESSAVWEVEYSLTQPTQIAVKTTPYLATDTGGLSAALDILLVYIRMQGGNDDYLSKLANGGVDLAERLPHAGQLIQGLFGDRLAQEFTKERLFSGQFARDIFDTLRDPFKAKVVQEALSLVGVQTNLDSLQSLASWLPAVPLLEMIWDMGSAIILSKSAGGVVFSSLPPIATTPATTVTTQPPATATSEPSTVTTRPPSTTTELTAAPTMVPPTTATTLPTWTTSVNSTMGWNYTPILVRSGDLFRISYLSGSWSVDRVNLPYVGPEGYSSSTDAGIYKGCKFDGSQPYGRLLAAVSGVEVAVAGGGDFRAPATGTVALRINDVDACLVDNDGSIRVQVVALG
jgi:hypothetical protein